MGILKDIFGKPRTQKFLNYYRPDFESMTELGQIKSIFEWVFSNPDLKKHLVTVPRFTIHRLLTSLTAFKNKSLYHSAETYLLKKKRPF